MRVLVFLLVLSTHNFVAGLIFIGHNTVSITKNLEVQGSLDIAQGLTVNGAVTANNGLSVASGASVLSGSLAVNGATTLKATTLSNAGLSITGASGTLSVSGAVTMNGATTVNNALYVGGALDVAGAITLKQTTINNAELTVTGASGSLSVSGDATFNGTVEMNAGLTSSACACGNMQVAPATVNVPTSLYPTLQAAWTALSKMIALAPITINVAKSATPYVSATQITLTGFTRHLVTITCSGGATVAADCTFSFAGTSGIVINNGALVAFSNGLKVVNTGAFGVTFGLLVVASQVTVGSYGLISDSFYDGMRTTDKGYFKCTGPISITIPSGANTGLVSIDGSTVIVSGTIAISGGYCGVYAGTASTMALVPIATSVTVSGTSFACVFAELSGVINIASKLTVYNCGSYGVLSYSQSYIRVSGCPAPPCLKFTNSGTTTYGVHAIYNSGVEALAGTDFGLTPFTSGFCVYSAYGGTVHLPTRTNKHGSVNYITATYADDFCNTGAFGSTCPAAD